MRLLHRVADTVSRRPGGGRRCTFHHLVYVTAVTAAFELLDRR
jgi:hypothetical protein